MKPMISRLAGDQFRLTHVQSDFNLDTKGTGMSEARLSRNQTNLELLNLEPRTLNATRRASPVQSSRFEVQGCPENLRSARRSFEIALRGKTGVLLCFSASRRGKAAVNTPALQTLREFRRSLAVAKRLDCVCL